MPQDPDSFCIRKASDYMAVICHYASIAVFHGSNMALTFDPCKSLKTQRGGRGSKLTPCAPGERWGEESTSATYRAKTLV